MWHSVLWHNPLANTPLNMPMACALPSSLCLAVPLLYCHKQLFIIHLAVCRRKTSGSLAQRQAGRRLLRVALPPGVNHHRVLPLQNQRNRLMRTAPSQKTRSAPEGHSPPGLLSVGHRPWMRPHRKRKRRSPSRRGTSSLGVPAMFAG